MGVRRARGNPHHPSRVPWLAAVLLAGAVAALTPGAVASGAFVHGSAGAGDPFFPLAGNGGYDVSHYGLTLRYEPSTDRLRAKATITAAATEGLSRFDLDLRGLNVTSLSVDGDRAAFTRRGQELVITPRDPLPDGKRFAVRVRYRGRPHPVIDPDGSQDGWIPTNDGAFVADEPQGAPTWFPCNDHPTDKATYDFRVTVPKGVVAVANGALERRIKHRRHQTFVWNEDSPMATYLATVTTGRFDVSRTRADGIPSYVAVDPTQSRAARGTLAKIPAILRLYSRKYGPYPFAETGAIVDDATSVGYALETQTRPLFDRAPDQVTLAHELSHQWFGDDVTPRRWRDIWLNEGFATWSEWFWAQHTGGPTARAGLHHLYSTSAGNTGFWNPPPANPGKPENLFDGTIYDRGGMTLEALREKVGSATFFHILRDWLSAHRYGNATTKEFIDLASADSGMNVRSFLHAWLYRPIQNGKPPLP
jgi:aminopeptidase N